MTHQTPPRVRRNASFSLKIVHFRSEVFTVTGGACHKACNHREFCNPDGDQVGRRIRFSPSKPAQVRWWAEGT